MIDHVLIHEQLGISMQGAVNVVNATFDKAKIVLKKNSKPTCLCWKWTMVCNSHERLISCQISNHFANSLSKRMISVF